MRERLEVSYKNSQEMLRMVDQIPERCGPWYTKRLSFKDSPKEFFTIRHRNPIEAIRGLWGDPAFAQHLVYKPAKLFRDADARPEDRIYNEMWTGYLWNAVQVGLSKSITSLHLTFLSEAGSCWCYSRSGHHCIRQDATHAIYRREGCVSCLPNHRKHP